MSKKLDGGFVSHTECTAIMSPLSEDIKIIKRNLIGDDMKSGMVQDVGDLRNRVEDVIHERALDEEKAKTTVEYNRKLKLAVLSLVFSLIGLVTGYLLNKV